MWRNILENKIANWTFVWYNLIGDNMEVKSIKQIKKNIYEVLIDDNLIQASSDIVIKYNLLSKRALDVVEYKKLVDDNLFYNELHKVMSFIEKKVRSKFEVETYVKKEEMKNGVKIIKYLEGNGFINNKLFLQAYINDKVNLTNDGYFKIFNDLLKHQFSEEEIKEELDEIDSELFDSKMEKLVKKKINSNKKKSKLSLAQTVTSQLIMLGYERDKILNCIDENYEMDEDILLKEYEKIRATLSKKHSDDDLNRHIIRKLLQKGFSYDEIKSVID